MSKFNSSYVGVRLDLVRHVEGKKLRVLDIGCATGENCNYLRGKGIVSHLEGVEIDEEMARIASGRIDKIIVGNIELPAVFNQISTELFDYIIIGDVLEHLENPWLVLQKLTKFLKPEGKVIFSVPNIGHIDVFIHIFIKGIWPYNDRGIFDRTHLRMFAKRNLFELVDYANLYLIKLERNFRYRDRLGCQFPRYGFLLKKLFPDLYTHQFVVVSMKKI